MQTSETTAAGAGGGVGRGPLLALTAALLGWMFDGAEMGVFSLVGRSALQDLLATSDEQVIARWFGIIMAAFLVGAATGGVLFGWLGDRIGRVRAMTLSVLTYAVFTGLCGVTTSAWQLGLLRFIAALGMGGEWSLGVALVMEVWPNRSRAFMAGLIGAAGNIGYLLVGWIGLGLSGVIADLTVGLLNLGLDAQLVEKLVHNQGWRIMMILGTAPALLTFLIRIFVPESQRWQNRQQHGATSHWQSRDLLAVLLGAIGPGMTIYLWANEHSLAVRLAGTVAGLAMAICGYMYPVTRYLQRQAIADRDGKRVWPTLRRMLLAAGLSGVALLGTWGATQAAPSWADKLTNSDPAIGAKYYVQMSLAVGAIVGCVLAAMMGDWFGRKTAYAMLCVLSIASLLWLYQGHDAYGNSLLVAAFAVGLCTASFYGWLPLYLPELFHTDVRATGQGFGFNFGRILAAVGTLQVGTFYRNQGGYPAACSMISMIYLVGLVLILFAPETRGRSLPD